MNFLQTTIQHKVSNYQTVALTGNNLHVFYNHITMAQSLKISCFQKTYEYDKAYLKVQHVNRNHMKFIMFQSILYTDVTLM